MRHAKINSRHEEELRFREARDKDALLKVRRDGNCVILSTYSRQYGKRGQFYILSDRLNAWYHAGGVEDFFDTDCGNILRIHYLKKESIFHVGIYWLSESTTGNITGIHQTFDVDAGAFMQSANIEQTSRILCRDWVAPTAYVWTATAREHLRNIAQDKRIRRALCKFFARNGLHWPGDTITFYGDVWSKYDLCFRAGCGIYGGLIHHETTRRGHSVVEYQTHT